MGGPPALGEELNGGPAQGDLQGMTPLGRRPLMGVELGGETVCSVHFCLGCLSIQMNLQTGHSLVTSMNFKGG